MEVIGFLTFNRCRRYFSGICLHALAFGRYFFWQYELILTIEYAYTSFLMFLKFGQVIAV